MQAGDCQCLKTSAPKKLFRIGEVSQLTGVNPHILRYWESELQILTPNRRLSKQRLYRQADIDLILEIKHLLEEERYTLQGVKQHLSQKHLKSGNAAVAKTSKAMPLPSNDALYACMQDIKEELKSIRDLLND
ncbi:MerR family transcriptional regulator [Desulfobacca acetoxidans]